MRASNNSQHYSRYVLFIVWIISTLVAATYFISARLVPFDPEKVLSSVTGNQLITELKSSGLLKHKDFINTVIHITSEDCHCSKFSKDHKAALNLQAQNDGFNVINIIASKKVRNIIPSTPAALITDKQGQLIYFGPYSEGLACSSSNGLIELVMNNYRKGFNSKMIVEQATGCYCNI